MEQSSSIVQHQPFQICLLRLEFQLDKLPQNDGEEDAGTEGRRNNCGKIEIYSDELVFTCSDKFLIRIKSDCTQKSRDTHCYGKPESRMRRNSKSDAASSSQAHPPRMMDAATGKLVATKEESGDVDSSESETGSLREEDKQLRRPCASSKSDHPGSPKA